ncbi:hypothetical protein Bca52824_069429 [Brassica carinata]|uniref:Myb/SANT-like DNA-binding domain-containing protein n=1 Tax=Brassica carinata TaxID=52824 RepID=A0A8X7U113_BRACI|nr:hypothetical protein Bca52824_069429 [Brassica carinata]
MDQRNPFHHHHQLHHLIQQQQLPPPPQSTTTAMDPGGGGERIPQWSLEETKELLGIREELDQTFMETKRNKLLWEVVAAKMADKGFAGPQNSVRASGRTSSLDTRRVKLLSQKLLDSSSRTTTRSNRFTQRECKECCGQKPQKQALLRREKHQFSSDEEEEEDIEELNQDINEELLSFVETHKKDAEVITTSTFTNPKKRAKKGKGTSKAEVAGSTLKEMLEDFMRQTVKMEKEWRDAWEMKTREKEKREKEWQRRMAELEEERAAAERRWMEREDERRLREEARAQKRDTLISILLNKLNRDHNDDQHQGF